MILPAVIYNQCCKFGLYTKSYTCMHSFADGIKESSSQSSQQKCAVQVVCVVNEYDANLLPAVIYNRYTVITMGQDIQLQYSMYTYYTDYSEISLTKPRQDMCHSLWSFLDDSRLDSMERNASNPAGGQCSHKYTCHIQCNLKRGQTPIQLSFKTFHLTTGKS